jgi:hypothetical protein
MVSTRGIARVGVLAVGLGIGAAVAHSPVAAADTSSDWLSSIDTLLSGGAVEAPSTSTLNLAISFNGTSLISDGSAVADSGTAGNYDLAIAYGPDSYALAEGGTGDYALADGSDANAEAGSENASSGNNYDSAYDIGNNTGGPFEGAFAGGASLVGGTDDGTNSHDTAYDIGNNGSDGSYSGAFAGDGTLFGTATSAGNGDTAYTYGNTDGLYDGAGAVGGNNNYASVSGDMTNDYDYAYAGDGTGNSAIDDTSANTEESEVIAGVGNHDYAYAYGPDNSTATAENGNDNIAYVDDPFGTAGSPDSATAGQGFSNDIAEVLFTHGNASATGADLAYDIITALGTLHG